MMENHGAVSKWLRVFFLSCVVFTAHGKEVGTIYLVPFQIQSLLPITADDIETMMDKPCVLTSKGLIRDIVAKAKPVSVPFNSDGVRAKITEGNETLVVDNQGTLSAEEETLAVSEDTFKKLVRKHSHCAAAK